MTNMNNTELGCPRKAPPRACSCGFKDNGDERRRREHDEEAERERCKADADGRPFWMRSHASPEELGREYREQSRRQEAEREQEQRLKLEAEVRARKDAAEKERQRCAEWRRRNAPHAPHLRAPPASVLDDDLRTALLSFPKSHDPHNQEGSPIVRIAPRLAIFAGGRPTIISGGPESMKSFSLSEIGLRVASGAPAAFGGAVPIELRGRVVHLDFENPGAHRTRERYRRLGGADALNDLLDVCAPVLFLDDPLVERSLIALLYGVVLCIIDSMQFGCRHQSERYGAALAMLGRVSAQTGTAMLVILHPVKGWEKRNGLDRLDFVTGRELDTVLWLQKDAHQITTITTIKNANSIGPIEPLCVRLTDEGEEDGVTGLSERIRFDAVGADSPRRSPSPAERLRRRILRALANGPLSGRAVRQEVKGGTDAIREELDALFAAGVIIFDDESRYVLLDGGPSRTAEPQASTERRREIMDLGSSAPPVEPVESPDVQNPNGYVDHRGPFRTADGVARGSSPCKGESRGTPPRSKRARRARQ